MRLLLLLQGYNRARRGRGERDFFNIKAGGTLSVSRTHKKKEIERACAEKDGGRAESGEREAIVLTKARTDGGKEKKYCSRGFCPPSLPTPIHPRRPSSRKRGRSGMEGDRCARIFLSNFFYGARKRVRLRQSVTPAVPFFLWGFPYMTSE